jgi:hypothetical protein
MRWSKGRWESMVQSITEIGSDEVAGGVEKDFVGRAAARQAAPVAARKLRLGSFAEFIRALQQSGAM